MIADLTVLQEIRSAWNGVEALRERIQLNQSIQDWNRRARRNTASTWVSGDRCVPMSCGSIYWSGHYDLKLRRFCDQLSCMSQSPSTWKEARRLHAWRPEQPGWSQRRFAEALGISAGAVSQWLTRAREGGTAALRRPPSPGAPRRLTAGQRAQLPAGSSGPAVGLPPGCSWSLASSTLRVMPAACAKRSGGAHTGPRDGRASPTQRPWPTGARRPGPPSQGGGDPRAHHPLPTVIQLKNPGFL
jgi:hypothetical protein